MKGFLETVAGFGITALILLAISVIYGLAHGETQAQVAPLIGWGVAIGAVTALCAGISRSMPSGGEASRPVTMTREDSADGLVWDGPPENEAAARRFAAALAMGGMSAIMARQWAAAFERDRSVPEFGVRPYWTPTGEGGSPRLLSTLGMRGTVDRLKHAREAAVGDPLLAIMEDDPDPRVSDMARRRRDTERGAWRE